MVFTAASDRDGKEAGRWLALLLALGVAARLPVLLAGLLLPFGEVAGVVLLGIVLAERLLALGETSHLALVVPVRSLAFGEAAGVGVLVVVLVVRHVIA
jgi:hypothetical protein